MSQIANLDESWPKVKSGALNLEKFEQNMRYSVWSIWNLVASSLEAILAYKPLN